MLNIKFFNIKKRKLDHLIQYRALKGSSRYSLMRLREESDICICVTCGHHGLVPVRVTSVLPRDLRQIYPLTLTVERRASPTSMVKSPFAGFPACHIEDIRLLLWPKWTFPLP